MYEDWEPIEDFPGYDVSNWGRVKNIKTESIVARTKNQNNVAMVGLSAEGVQHKRAVDLLVANAFLDPHFYPAFMEAVIHLDGDLQNCYVDNLMWRPRWFKMAYQKQFRQTDRMMIKKPVYCVDLDRVYPNTTVAMMELGVLEKDIVFSLSNGPGVWPYGYDFEIAD